MNKKIEDELERYDFRTYRDYLKLRQVNTKAYLMISELIDNSISSMDNNSMDGKIWKRKLNISLKMDLSTPTAKKEKLHQIEVYKKDYISLKDNAFGMDADTIRKAMKLNGVNNQTKSAMNTHGRGLKQSGFYFGTDLIVSTNNGNEKNRISLELSKQESLDSRIVFDVVPSKKQKVGTIVRINNLIAKNRLTVAAWKNVKTAIFERYKKYLSEDAINKMSIEYDVIFSNADSDNGVISGEYSKVISVVSVLNIEKFEQITELTKKQLLKKIKLSPDDIVENVALATFENIKNIFLEAKEDTNTIFKFTQTLEFNGIKTPVSFWMLEKRNAKFRGLKVYENQRAILHGPIVVGEMTTYIDWYDRANRTGSTINRFSGEFDIVDCDLKTTTDKSNFDVSKTVKENMDKQIMTVWEVFDMFVMQGREEEKREEGQVADPEEIKSMEATFNSKYNEQKVKFRSYDKKKHITKMDIHLANGEDWTFEIKLNKKVVKNNIFDKEIKEDEHKLIMIANTHHMFWKKIDKMTKKKFVSELVLPLAILLGLQLLSSKFGIVDKEDTIDWLNMNSGIFDGNN